jgi:hypothetical protein
MSTPARLLEIEYQVCQGGEEQGSGTAKTLRHTHFLCRLSYKLNSC